MEINQIINEKLKMLLNSGINSSRFELKILIADILKIEPKDVAGYIEMNKAQIALLDDMLQQRLQHRPIDKIVGHKGFYKYEFVVNDNVLSPRSDTEILVEKAIEVLRDKPSPKILELGIGSGCIILSILADTPNAYGIGIDISEEALAITDINADKLGIENNRLKLIQSSWFNKDLEKILKDDAPFDIIVSNPPYIASGEISDLDAEVKNYDPLVALDGGPDGLRDYDRILELGAILLNHQGFILLESGNSEQLHQIAAKAKKYMLEYREILTDLSGNERCIILKK